MNKELRNAIYTRSRFNKFCKSPSKENEALYKKQLNKRVSFRRKRIKKYFNGVTKYGIATNKNVWNLIKPFLTNKGHLNYQDIVIFDGKKIITNETKIAEVLTTTTLILLKNRLVKNQDMSHVVIILKRKRVPYQ